MAFQEQSNGHFLWGCLCIPALSQKMGVGDGGQKNVKGFGNNLVRLVPGREPKVKMFNFSSKERPSGYYHLPVRVATEEEPASVTDDWENFGTLGD